MPSPSCSLPVQLTMISEPGDASAGACIVIVSGGGRGVGPEVTIDVGVAAAPPHAPTSSITNPRSATSPGLGTPISLLLHVLTREGRRSPGFRLGRGRDLAVAPLDVALENADELVDEALAAERPVEPAVDEYGRDRLLERAR